MGIRKKILLPMIISAAFGIAFFFMGAGYFAENYIINQNLDLLKKDNQKYEYQISSFFADIKNDVLVLIPEFKFKELNGLSTLPQSTKEHLLEQFINIINIHKFYNQVRYIDENGDEILRVDYDKQIKSAKIIPNNKLQNKKDRPYFIETMKLSEGEYYVSPVDLNREGSPPEIEIPYKPVIRYAIPIFDDKKNRKGILVTNIFAEDFLSFLKNSSKDVEILLLDQNGYYLFAPDNNKLWGNSDNLNTGQNYKKDFPQFADRVLSKGTGSILDTNVIFYTPITLGGITQLSFIIISSVPQSVVLQPIYTLTVQVVIVAAIILLISIIFFSLLLNKILNPLELLSSGAKKISEGNLEQSITVTSKDEIGQVGIAFNEMVVKLKDLYRGLEERVNERTKLLTENITKLEDTKKATLNLLEDIQIEKAKTDEQKELFSSLIANLPVGVFIAKAPNGEPIMMNNMATKLLGRTLTEKVDIHTYAEVFNMFKPDGTRYPDSELPLAISFAKGSIASANDISILRPDGRKIVIKAISAPVRDQKGNVTMAVVVFDDITREKEVDRMKTEFVSIASHQLRTPLTAMRWLLEILEAKETGELNSVQSGVVKDLHTSNQKMIYLVNMLLSVARIESGRLNIEVAPTDLKKIVEEVQKELEVSIQANKQQVVINIANDLPLISVDPKLIKEVYLNLVSNAVKYTPAGGQISITIFIKDNEVISKVSDSGCGIPELNKKDIFKKFYRADNVVKNFPHGNGLGLYFAKSIVELSSGRMGFESVEGKGTTFWFSLPIHGVSNTLPIQ